MQNKILITGGAGNIGSALVLKLLEKFSNFVVVADDLSTGSLIKLPDKIKENWTFVHCDVNDYSQISVLMEKYKFDYVFHLAAVVGVQRTQQFPLKVLQDIEGIRNILNLSVDHVVKKVYFSSSSEVYGEPVELPQHEIRTPLNSRVPYAVVKNVGECFFRSYQQQFGLDYTIFRFFNTYGPNQSIDFVVSKFLAAALKNEEITVYGDGSQTRTFTFIDDNIETIIKCHENNLFNNDVVNIGSSALTSVFDLANLILRITGSKSVITYLPPLKDGDMTRRQPDNSKMLAILGRELITLEEGIRRMMNSTVFLRSIGL